MEGYGITPHVTKAVPILYEFVLQVYRHTTVSLLQYICIGIGIDVH